MNYDDDTSIPPSFEIYPDYPATRRVSEHIDLEELMELLLGYRSDGLTAQQGWDDLKSRSHRCENKRGQEFPEILTVSACSIPGENSGSYGRLSAPDKPSSLGLFVFAILITYELR